VTGTALIYIRQSRHKEHERTVSPEVQEHACRQLPAVQACAQVIVYKDLDVSGGKLRRRAQWRALSDRLEAARKGEPLVLALYDQSRAFRNTADALELYALLERKPWIEVVFVHGRFDRSPAGEFSYTAMAAAHAMERRMAAEKIREAKHYRSAQGEAVGPLPAGYAWGGEGRSRHVEIDEATAPLVRRLFAEYASGRYSSRLLAHRLNAEGAILPANTGPKEIRGKGWHGDTIMQVLANVAYIGKTYSVSRRHQLGELIDAAWPALITQETWDAVQRQRARYRRKGGRMPVGTTEARHYTFQGMLRCTCGRRLSVQTGRSHVYYRCRGFDAPDRCETPMVREEAILPWARSLMAALADLAPVAFEEQTEALAVARDGAPTALENVEESLRRADFMFYSAKRWDEAHYAAEVARLTQIRDELVAQGSPDRVPLDFTGVLEAWDSGDPLTRRELLLQLFDALDVEDGEVASWLPRSDRASEVVRLMDRVVGAEREGFEPSMRVTPHTAFPVRRPRPD
jgi:DNA invertase Pin-like site-specific DNA recombinase